MHIDYSPAGARQILRNVRKDICEEAEDIIAAEDATAAQGNFDHYHGRRYGIFSFWRPLKTVTRDPIAVLDPASFYAEMELAEFVNKQLGTNGPFLAGLHMLKGDNADQHRWFWLSEQNDDEVLLIQFFGQPCH
jgi:hypothetical protein